MTEIGQPQCSLPDQGKEDNKKKTKPWQRMVT